jgi:hypothetical protein
VVQVPVVGQPGAERQGPSALEQALGAIPRGLQALGEAGVQVEAIQLRQEEMQLARQKAFDTLNGKTAGVGVRVPMQTLDAELRQKDWQTAPEQLFEQGTKLIQEQGKTLTPQARAIYEHDAQTYLSVLHGRATEERVRQTKQMTAFVLGQQVSQAQHDFASATNDYDRTVARGQVALSVQQMVQAGAIEGAVGANALKKLDETMAVQQVKTAIYADPDRMDVQLRTQAKIAMGATDLKLDPALPTAPPEYLADLGKEATAVKEHRLSQEDHLQRRADYQWGKHQEETARDLQARISMLQPTPENVAQYDRLLAEVNQKAQGAQPLLDYTQQRVLDNELKSLKAAALNPRQTSDRQVEEGIIIRMDAAQNDRDYQILRQQIVNSVKMLKPDDFQKYLNQTYERRRADHYSKLPGYQDGVKAIMAGDVPEGTMNIPGFGKLEMEARQSRLKEALDIFNNRFAELAGMNRDQANAQGAELGRQIRYAIMDVGDKESRSQRMPKPLLAPDGKTILSDETQVLHNLHALPATDADKERLYRQWQQYRRTPGPEGAVTPGAPGTPSTPLGAPSAPAAVSSPTGRAKVPQENR